MGFRVIKKATEGIGTRLRDLDAIISKANVAPTDQITRVGMAAGQRRLTFVVTLDSGAPKLILWFAEWEANREAQDPAYI